MSLDKKLETLVQFKERYYEYLDLEVKSSKSNSDIERLVELRELLNNKTMFVVSYLNAVGISTNVYMSPSPMFGGIKGNIDIFANLFDLRKLQLPNTHPFDMLDRGIGCYEFEIEKRNNRRLNPLFWIGEIIRLPFLILKFAGFNSIRIESSIFGKSYKFIAALVALTAGVIKIYEFCKDSGWIK